MKDIIIIGCQRSGKTTLANLIIQNNPEYMLLSLDGFIRAFSKAFPETNIHYKTCIAKKSLKFVPFLETYLRFYKMSYPKTKYIIEGCQLLPKDLCHSDFFKDATIICLGYPNMKPESLFQTIRTYDLGTKAYTTYLSDEELKKRILSWIEYSKRLEQSAKQNNIAFFDTSIHRANILNHIVDLLNQ